MATQKESTQELVDMRVFPVSYFSFYKKTSFDINDINKVLTNHGAWTGIDFFADLDISEGLDDLSTAIAVTTNVYQSILILLKNKTISRDSLLAVIKAGINAVSVANGIQSIVLDFRSGSDGIPIGPQGPD